MKTIINLLVVLLFTYTVSAQTVYKKNDRVEVYYTGSWYKAQVIGVDGTKYRVHYDGYDASWDEAVEASRIRRIGDKTPLPATPTLPATKTSFRKGDRVRAQGDSESSGFYEASIMEVSGGKYKIRWEKSDSPDEWKTGEQLKSFDFGKTAGGPPPGKYVCYLLGAVFGGQSPTYTGTIEILPKGKYQYLVGKPAETRGTYRFDEQTRRLTWTSGKIANREGVYGEYSNTEKDGPYISLIFPPGKRKGNIQECKYNGKIIHFIDSPYKY